MRSGFVQGPHGLLLPVCASVRFRSILATFLRFISAFLIIYPVILAQSDDPIAATRQADELVSRALAVDPSDDHTRVVKAWVLMAQNRHEEAIVEAERGLALSPSNVDAYTAIGVSNNFLCRPERVFEAVDKAIRLSPRDPNLGGFYEVKAEAYFVMRQDTNDRMDPTVCDPPIR